MGELNINARLSLQHRVQTQGSGGVEPGLRGVSGPAAGLLFGALRRGVALGPRRKWATPGRGRRPGRHRRLQGGLQLGQQVRSTLTSANGSSDDRFHVL